MIGQARFTYTAADMVATQRAGWTWYAHWRNLLIAYVGLAGLYAGFLVAMNAMRGTQSASTDLFFVIVTPAIAIVVLLGVSFRGARNHALQMLHGTNNRVLGAWGGSELGGEQAWAWDGAELHLRSERAGADLSWTSVGAWLDTPKVLLLFPPGGGAFAFTLPKQALETGWQDAPKLLIWPFGGHALTLPKRTLESRDADLLVDVLRSAGIQERRRFGLIAAKDAGAR